MKYFFYILISILFFSTGCKETTEPETEPISNPAKTVVINELFRIDSAKYYSHWWLELYNPTGSSINITEWKIRFINSNLFINLNQQTSVTNFEKGTFLLITSNTTTFNDYWNVAPQTTLVDFKTTYSPLKSCDEIQIIDGKGDIINVFRYGNYSPSGENQFPSNKSYGNVSEWHSFCRYADPHGAYDTGNSSNDFFEESNPIAGYYSQRMKQ